MDRGPIERCKREIAAIEAELLAGNPDLPGLCLALSDWHAEWRILEEERRCSTATVLEIARRLNIGRMAVYAMLEQGLLPGLRLGRRWIITRHAYLTWERTCGLRAGTGLRRPPELMV